MMESSCDTRGGASRRVEALARHLVSSPTSGTVASSAPLWNPNGVREVVHVHENLASERAKASFPVRELTHLLDGGEKYTLMKEEVMRLLERDPAFDMRRVHDRSREERRLEVIDKIAHLVDISHAIGLRRPEREEDFDELEIEARWQPIKLQDCDVDTRVGVHNILFLNAILNQGSPEQVQQFGEPAKSQRLYGCFCMTELGHGSSIPGFETTAVFDQKTDEFVIQTPSLTATKWWIGGAAATATHSVVFARLVTNGKDHGVHSFIVQLRDQESGRLLPGVLIGDCGEKMGRHGVDNGWVQFNGVRIPRVQMLSRYAQVERDGTYKAPPKPQLAYGALLAGRGMMVMDSSLSLRLATTIAIRYGAIRRQFFKKGNSGEEEVLMNYQTHQFRLLPLLAGSYMIHFAARRLQGLFRTVRAELSEGNLKNLQDAHATSAGLKACATWICHNGIDTCRQCLGGHGYSAYSGLSKLFNDFAVMCTWEGDNTILCLQTARYLLTSLAKVSKGKQARGSVAYFNDAATLMRLHANAKNVDGMLCLDELTRAMRWRSVFVTSAVGKLIQQLRKSGASGTDASNRCSQDLVRATKAHCYAYMAESAVEAIAAAPSSLQSVLKEVAALFLLFHMEDDVGTFLEGGFLAPSQVPLLREAVRLLCRRVREQAVPLVDAFNISDRVLNSPFGRYDGDVYRDYFYNYVRGAPNATGKAPYYDSHVRALVHEPSRKIDTKENPKGIPLGI